MCAPAPQLTHLGAAIGFYSGNVQVGEELMGERAHGEIRPPALGTFPFSPSGLGRERRFVDFRCEIALAPRPAGLVAV